jgi:rhodanese-related sulfurtransferase
MPVFRQLFDPSSSTYTYLLADRKSGEAIVLDPVSGQVRRVAVCRAGSRSAQATVMLREAGVSEAANLAGGMLRWCAAGHPVEGGSALEYVAEYSI